MSLANLFNNYFRSAKSQQFDNLLAEHFDEISRLTYRLTDQPSDAEDLLQEFLIVMVKKQDDFLQAQNPKSYLLRSLNNLYIDRWRSVKNSPLRYADSEDALRDYHAEQPSTEDELHHQQIQQRIEQLLPLLPPERRTVLVMHDMLGYSLPEISQELNINLGTLKSRLHRARQTLRNELNMLHW